MISSKTSEKRPKDQKTTFIYNRRTLKFDEDEASEAIELKLAESYIKNIIKDFEENSEIWIKRTKKRFAVIFGVSLIGLIWGCLSLPNSGQREIPAISSLLSLVLLVLSVFNLAKEEPSGDDKAILYFCKSREVYNMQLFYHNLRVELAYYEKDGGREMKEGQFLGLEFIVLKNYRNQKKNRNSFLTSDSTIGELRSEKLSPFDEEIMKKKSHLGTSQEERSYQDSNMRLISHRTELSIVDEEENFSEKKDVKSRLETQQETERGLLNEDEEFEYQLKETGEANYAGKRGFNKNLKNFDQMQKDDSSSDSDENASHDYRSGSKSSNSKENQIAKYLNSNTSNQMPIKFNSFYQNNTPKLASFKNNSTTKPKIDSKEDKENEKDEESFVRYSREKKKENYSFKEAREVEIKLSNKKPSIPFDEISISPNRKNKPQRVVQERVEEDDSGTLPEITQPNFDKNL